MLCRVVLWNIPPDIEIRIFLYITKALGIVIYFYRASQQWGVFFNLISEESARKPTALAVGGCQIKDGTPSFVLFYK